MNNNAFILNRFYEHTSVPSMAEEPTRLKQDFDFSNTLRPAFSFPEYECAPSPEYKHNIKRC